MHSHLTRAIALAVPLIAAGSSIGCSEKPPPETAQSVQRYVDREAAIASARQDASVNYREVWVSEIEAQRQGSFWVVELRSAGGPSLRYAISTQDGSIRERRMFQ